MARVVQACQRSGRKTVAATAAPTSAPRMTVVGCGRGGVVRDYPIAGDDHARREEAGAEDDGEDGGGAGGRGNHPSDARRACRRP